MKYFLILVLLLASSCAEIEFDKQKATMEATCGTHLNVITNWECFREHIPTAGVVSVDRFKLIAGGDLIVERYKANKITEAEARALFAQLMTEISATETARKTVSSTYMPSTVYVYRPIRSYHRKR